MKIGNCMIGNCSTEDEVIYEEPPCNSDSDSD